MFAHHGSIVRILRPKIPRMIVADQYFPKDIAHIGTEDSKIKINCTI